jgi:endonuclease YncB( thermonuclease family)
MDTRDLLQHVKKPLGGISLEELLALRDRLDESRAAYEAQLAAVEAQQAALFADGSGRPDVRGQQARARQVRDLDAEAEQIATLLRITQKQRRLLDRLIWLRENLATLERLQATSAAAVPEDWPALVDATAGLADEEAQLELLTAGLPTADCQPTPVLQPPPPESHALLVVRVLDGATIELAGGQKVRYIGVDSPTMRNALGKPDAGAWEARDANRHLVTYHRVRLEADQLDSDADGAWWRYVYIGDTLVNADLLRQGVVLHLSRYPNTRLTATLLAAEQEARRHKRGLWKE